MNEPDDQKGRLVLSTGMTRVFFTGVAVLLAAGWASESRAGMLESTVGTTTCNESDSLSGGWVEGHISWTHTFPQPVGAINWATITIDVGDADGASLDLQATDGTYIGVLTGGSNGGPGTWECPDQWIGGADLTLTIPTSLHDELQAGTLSLETTNDTGLGWWGSNRATIVIDFEGSSVVNLVGNIDCDEATSLTGGWVNTAYSWTHEFTPPPGYVTWATITMDIGDADGQSVTLRGADGTFIGVLSGGDNGGPGTWQCPDAWIGGEDHTFYIPPELYDELTQGHLSLQTTDDTGVGWWGSNRAIIVMEYEGAADIEGTTDCDSADSVSGGWVDTDISWAHSIPVLADPVNWASITMDAADLDGATLDLRHPASGINIGTLTSGDNGGPGTWQCPGEWTGGEEHTFLLPTVFFSELDSGSLSLETAGSLGDWWGSNRALIRMSTTGMYDVEGAEDCSETGTLTGGWADTDILWTHSFQQPPGPVVWASVTVDVGDIDLATMTLQSKNGTYIGTLTGGDNGGPGTWQCPAQWAGGADNTFVIPSTLYTDLSSGYLDLETAGASAAGTWGSNRSILYMKYHGIVDVEGSEDCTETSGLTGGWTFGSHGWSHTYDLVSAPIISATLIVDIGDADGESIELLADDGTIIGTITGGDNGGPGSWACPDTWGGGADNVLSIPSSLFDDLADGKFNVTTGNDTGVGSWGSNRSMLSIVTDPPFADLDISKTNGQSTIVAGTVTTYTIVVTNKGPDEVTGATVSDVFPAAITDVNWTCAATGGGVCTASGTGDIDDDVTLPYAGSVTYTATGSVDAGATGNLLNSAYVTVPDGAIDPDTGDNSAEDKDSLISPDLFADDFESGDTSAWSLTVGG